jgi:hypothetical protein
VAGAARPDWAFGERLTEKHHQNVPPIDIQTARFDIVLVRHDVPARVAKLRVQDLPPPRLTTS